MTKSTGYFDAARARQSTLFSVVARHLERFGPSGTAALRKVLGIPYSQATESLRWARRNGLVVCVGRGPWAKWCLPKDEASHRYEMAVRVASRNKTNNLAHRQRALVRDEFQHKVVPASRVKLRLHPRAVRSVFDLGMMA